MYCPNMLQPSERPFMDMYNPEIFMPLRVPVIDPDEHITELLVTSFIVWSVMYQLVKF